MLISVMKIEIKKRLPANYSVWTDTYIWLHEPDAETRRGKPDVLVGGRCRAQAKRAAGVLTAPASTMLPAIKRESAKYLKIRDVQADRVVTVVELISPSSKEPGDDRDMFLVKRYDYLKNRTNVVEIDLHRGGLRLPLGKPQPPKGDYYVFVSRAIDYPKIAIWPLSVRERLPELSIPLNPEDGVIALPLQPCLDVAYDQGPYGNEVDYSKPPKTPLSIADSSWASKLLTKTGHRAGRGA